MTAKTKGKLRKPITSTVIDNALEWLANGGTVRQFCIKHEHSMTQVYERLRSPDISDKVARAREVGEQAIIDEMIEIADTASKHEDDVAHRKLQLWMREKRLVWSSPDKYGQKKQHEHRHAHAHLHQLSDVEREIRIQQLLDKARVPRVEVEVNPEETEETTNDGTED